jgi:predicted cupin superfamily sugar epimerase
MNTYKIYFRGRCMKHFHDRDQALAWIAMKVRTGYDFEDYEILDGSDEL